MNDPTTTRTCSATFKNRDGVTLKRLYRSVEFLLLAQGIFGVCWLDPLGSRAAIGCQKAGLYIVAMELPARVVINALQPHVDNIALDYAGKN